MDNNFAKPRGYKNSCASEAINVKEEKVNDTWSEYLRMMIMKFCNIHFMEESFD